MFKAVLFDMDDLMVDSEPIHTEASRRVFARFGVDVAEIPEDVVATYFGRRVSEIVRLVAEFFHLGGEVDVEALIAEREEIFLELVKNELEPMPGLFAIISKLRPLAMKRAVASSGTRVYIDTVLEKFGLSDFFDAIVSGDMVRKGKPDPEIFSRAAELLGVEPRSCVVLEDSTSGVEAAKRAGMFCIGVVNPVSPYKQDLSRADMIVMGLDEVNLTALERRKE